MKKIPIGISSCLLGQNVRFDGGHKLDAYINGTLVEYFDFIPFARKWRLVWAFLGPPFILSNR